jgi:hypothetical protein
MCRYKTYEGKIPAVDETLAEVRNLIPKNLQNGFQSNDIGIAEQVHL